MSKICVIGIGWLGLELAKCLKQQNYYVIGTTTSTNKLKRHKNKIDELYLFDLYQGNLLFIKEIDQLILTIPPSGIPNYAKAVCSLLVRIKKMNPEIFVVYTSSTSVYGDEKREVDEESSPNPQTKSAKQIVLIENYLIENMTNQSAVCRLGGLIGGERHPIKFLAGKKQVKKPFARVNLVHRTDAVKAIHLILQRKGNGIFNLCSPQHPIRSAYYSKIAEQFSLEKVVFDSDDKREDKIVNCKAIKRLDFEFNYPSPYDFPAENT